MPSLMLRDLPADLVARVRAFARGRGLSLVAGAVELLEAGLERRASQAAGGTALRDQTAPDVRAERARADAESRWARNRDSGRYAHTRDRRCACGHTLGTHTAESTEHERPCMAGDCACEQFTPE